MNILLIPKKIHFNGVGYYYTDMQGIQISKQYKTIARLRYYVGV